jgi:hypothetical protein
MSKADNKKICSKNCGKAGIDVELDRNGGSNLAERASPQKPMNSNEWSSCNILFHSF